ncbi:MAG: hypothetical protein KC777_01275 [Cyanobacteria bacterium HKST-UBA02]|nr:hypothetical protein [Cyanobacteria bacterium HKST-UBA02]
MSRSMMKRRSGVFACGLVVLAVSTAMSALYFGFHTLVMVNQSFRFLVAGGAFYEWPSKASAEDVSRLMFQYDLARVDSPFYNRRETEMLEKRIWGR